MLIVPMTIMATSPTILIFSEFITDYIPHANDQVQAKPRDSY
jgi:hypothetical protein